MNELKLLNDSNILRIFDIFHAMQIESAGYYLAFYDSASLSKCDTIIRAQSSFIFGDNCSLIVLSLKSFG